MPKKTAQNRDDSTLLAIPEGDDLYDMLMIGIEPELVSENLESIRETANNDTADERKVRADRYAAAFTEYDRRFAAYKRDWERASARYKKQTMASLEKQSEGTGLSDIERTIAAS